MNKKIINDFTIKIATINGTGSQSANNILFKTLIRMGIPTSAKNLFPSNIQGLPTWFHIRTSPQGYESMRRQTEILVAVNPATIREDLKEVQPGHVVIYDSTTIRAPEEKEGIIYYPVPLSQLSKSNFDHPRIRTLLTNTVYVGVIAELFNLDREIVTQVIKDTFQKKQKVVDVNLKAVELGSNYAKEKLKKKDPYYYQHDNKTQGKIVLEGNAAGALGAIMGGCTVTAWYPITPASSLSESIEGLQKKFRTDPKTGKRNIAVIQAEDEIAAIGIAIGAGWAGARAMTGTSGPGISLMSEFLGLAYYAEIPVVVFNVQRVGPSTGLPTRTQQGDFLLCAFASHGDTKHPMLFPATVKEYYEIAASSFDIAERLQTAVFVMADLELGMNLWMSEPFPYIDKPFDRGKVLTEKEVEKLKLFKRYEDVDGDGIPYRTLPGTPHPLAAYFTRGSGHDEAAGYTEDHATYERNMKRLDKKFETAKHYLPKPLWIGDKKAKIGILGVGTTHHAIMETIDLLKEKKIATQYLRPLAFPFHDEVKDFINGVDKVIVVEGNRDGQLAFLLKTSCPGFEKKILSAAFSDGLPMDPVRITNRIAEVAHG
ncbi:MAG: 2-oxoacid:acceptor oxidoreductase subunit alpha [Deltaproteobacteria bacterium]